MVPFKPMHDCVLVRVLPQGETPGGIVLPDAAQEQDKAEVIAVGPGRISEYGNLIEPRVQPGDIVYLHFMYAGPKKLTLNGVEYLLTRERDIAGLFNDEVSAR